MLILKIDKQSKTPIFKQIIEQIIEKVNNETIKIGFKLPPTRKLAEQLGINRTTVYKAYQELWAWGYIESKIGSSCIIRAKRDCSKLNKNEKKPLFCNSIEINKNAENLFNSFKNVGSPFQVKSESFNGIDFSLLHPDPRLYPFNDFRKALTKVLVNNPSEILDYGDTSGYRLLKEFIAERMRFHSISITGDEILITNGAQNGIDLICKLLISTGCRVFVESPTYGMILQTLKYYPCEIVEIPMAENGVNLSAFESEIKNGIPSFFYTMPNFQNPTGITSSQENRENLINICEKYNIPIIEDAFEEEMKYFGKVPLPIKSMDNSSIVFYIGSFSKILFPGIRIGWIAANKYYIDRLTVLKRCSDMSTSFPIQAALYEFCKEGNYELHIKRIHKIYRKRMLKAIEFLYKHLNKDRAHFIEPNGGFTIWVTIKNSTYTYEQIKNIFNEEGIRLASGNNFYATDNKEKSFRISISQLNENEIEEGIKKLSSAINNMT